MFPCSLNGSGTIESRLIEACSLYVDHALKDYARFEYDLLCTDLDTFEYSEQRRIVGKIDKVLWERRLLMNVDKADTLSLFHVALVRFAILYGEKQHVYVFCFDWGALDEAQKEHSEIMYAITTVVVLNKKTNTFHSADATTSVYTDFRSPLHMLERLAIVCWKSPLIILQAGSNGSDGKSSQNYLRRSLTSSTSSSSLDSLYYHNDNLMYYKLVNVCQSAARARIVSAVVLWNSAAMDLLADNIEHNPFGAMVCGYIGLDVTVLRVFSLVYKYWRSDVSPNNVDIHLTYTVSPIFDMAKYSQNDANEWSGIDINRGLGSRLSEIMGHLYKFWELFLINNLVTPNTPKFELLTNTLSLMNVTIATLHSLRDNPESSRLDIDAPIFIIAAKFLAGLDKRTVATVLHHGNSSACFLLNLDSLVHSEIQDVMISGAFALLMSLNNVAVTIPDVTDITAHIKFNLTSVEKTLISTCIENLTAYCTQNIDVAKCKAPLNHLCGIGGAAAAAATAAASNSSSQETQSAAAAAAAAITHPIFFYECGTMPPLVSQVDTFSSDILRQIKIPPHMPPDDTLNKIKRSTLFFFDKGNCRNVQQNARILSSLLSAIYIPSYEGSFDAAYLGNTYVDRLRASFSPSTQEAPSVVLYNAHMLSTYDIYCILTALALTYTYVFCKTRYGYGPCNAKVIERVTGCMSPVYMLILYDRYVMNSSNPVLLHLYELLSRMSPTREWTFSARNTNKALTLDVCNIVQTSLLDNGGSRSTALQCCLAQMGYLFSICSVPPPPPASDSTQSPKIIFVHSVMLPILAPHHQGYFQQLLAVLYHYTPLKSAFLELKEQTIYETEEHIRVDADLTVVPYVFDSVHKPCITHLFVDFKLEIQSVVKYFYTRTSHLLFVHTTTDLAEIRSTSTVLSKINRMITTLNDTSALFAANNTTDNQHQLASAHTAFLQCVFTSE